MPDARARRTRHLGFAADDAQTRRHCAESNRAGSSSAMNRSSAAMKRPGASSCGRWSMALMSSPVRTSQQLSDGALEGRRRLALVELPTRCA